jgi:tRNA-specific 2-thiouridylase
MNTARRVAAGLGIPFYAIDAQQSFYEIVVKYFIDGYTQGITPNPCLICNRTIRWHFLYHHARALGADYLASGHYARIRRDSRDHIQLLRAKDKHKDQSYVLFSLNQELLAHTLFPLGNYLKSEVRDIALHRAIPAAHRRESQDLCFLAGGDYRDFLVRNTTHIEKPGSILNRDGDVLGEHRGLALYTIGQRKGLTISHPQPLYVLEKDIQNNNLIVGTSEQLGSMELYAHRVSWISGEPPAQLFKAQVKIRYRANEIPGDVTLLEDQRIKIGFNSPVRDITPGQAAVLYQEDICLGGGTIQ